MSAAAANTWEQERGEPMAEKWSIKGDYASACVCDVTCPCNLGQDPTKGECAGILAFSIAKGSYGKTDLSGRKAVLAAEIPGNLFDGNWKVALYVDEEATPDQRDALRTILSGEAGGKFAELAGLVTEFKGLKQVPIVYKDGGSPTIQIGDHSSVHVETLIGADEKNPIVLQNGMFPFRDNIRLGKTSARFVDEEYGWRWTFKHAESTPVEMTS